MSKMITESLSEKIFINEFITAFDGDKSEDPNPRQTPGMLYCKVNPTPVKKPELLAWSEELAASAGIQDPEKDDINILGGNLVSATMFPYAACYAGHQFGNWAGQLGDGRAITLGEWQTPSGTTLELQLKGAGPTPYSRRGDGRAVLRSSVREYLMSEAMFYLGIPTTRALSLVTTGDQVLRDMFYDGRPALEPGAIVMRVSPSFLRFGNFEMLAARQETAHLRQLTDWTIERFYPHLTGENKIIKWFGEVVSKTASLMVDWARVGFVHGVMNTDNMSVLGLTIDYGPFSFLDAYDLDFTPNTTDMPGRRYAFGKQHAVAYWNLGCLASAIAPLLKNTKELIAVLEDYRDIYDDKYHRMMAAKLGFDELRTGDRELIGLFEELLAELRPDMTIFYQLLIDLPGLDNELETINHFRPCFYDIPNPSEARSLYELIQRYQERMMGNAKTTADTAALMRANNPRFILRNYLLHEAIEALEKGNDQLFIQLKEAIRHPYSTANDQFFKLRPEWANDQPGSSTLSCSS